MGAIDGFFIGLVAGFLITLFFIGGGSRSER